MADARQNLALQPDFQTQSREVGRNEPMSLSSAASPSVGAPPDAGPSGEARLPRPAASSPVAAAAVPDKSDPERRRLRLAERAVLVAVVAGMVALVLGHRYLPMNDAPSHIANAVIASGLWHGDAWFHKYYELQAVPLPYWAVALSLAPLQALLPPLVAFRVLVALYVVMLPLSFLALVRAARRPTTSGGEADAACNQPLAAMAALMAMNWSYFLGEANFFLGQPLVLFALALFVRPFRLRSLRLLGFVLLSAAVYLCHIYALTALCGAMFAFALQGLVAQRRLGLSRGQWAAAAWAAALFGLGAYFVLFAHGTDANTGGRWAFDFSLRKAGHLLIDPLDSPSSPSRPVLLAAVAALFLVLLGPRLAALRRSPRAALAESLHWPLLAPALLLLAVAFLGPVALVRPDGTLKEGEIAMRLLLSGWLLLLGGVRLRRCGWARPALLVLVVLLAGFKLHDAYRLHHRADARVRAVSTQLLLQVPPESRLLPLMDFSSTQASAVDFLDHRLGNYVVVERHGYSPHVFAVLGQHPLRHRLFGDYRAVSLLTVSPAEWRFYDYVLIQTPHREPQVPGLRAHADFVAATGDFQLFRIRLPAP